MMKSKKIKYLIEYWLVLLIFNITSIIGLENSAKSLGFILKKIKNLLSFTKIARQNIKLVYNLPIAEQEELIDRIYDNFGRFLAEIASLRSMDIKAIQGKITINGMEHIHHLQQKQQPFFIFTAHIANWEFALAALTTIYPNSAVVHRVTNNPYINDLISAQRKKFGISLIPKGPEGGKGLIKNLKEKRTIAMLVDQKMNEGIKVPFMGQNAMTSDGLAKLALSFHYPIVPLQIVRINNSSNFNINIFKPLKITPSNNKEQDIYNITLAMNQTIEQWINANPDQWLWFHRRWTK
jgi:KDO2-lipid IV(A) lauroyltransferase